jgi:SAM-dependent methyltransferase
MCWDHYEVELKLESNFPADLNFDARMKWCFNTTPGRVLNLGAGVNLIKGADNHDLLIRPGIQVAFDLLQDPWPIPNETYAVVMAFHVLEHIPIHHTIMFLSECHRVLRHEGGLILEVPDMPKMAKEYLEGNLGMVGRMYGSYVSPGEGHVWGWDRSQLMYASRLAGFKICLTRDGTDYHSIQIPTIRLEAIKS